MTELLVGARRFCCFADVTSEPQSLPGSSTSTGSRSDRRSTKPTQRLSMRFNKTTPLLLATTAALCSLVEPALGQMQFEIPVEMMQGMFGGQMGGGGGGPKGAEWPKSENSEIVPELAWLVNTEWGGKSSKYLLLKDGTVESSLKECEPEGNCLWAANDGKVLINTPKLKVVRFNIQNLDKCDRKKLEEKDEVELKKVSLQQAIAGKSGKKSVLSFVRVAKAEDEEGSSKDLFKVLDLPEDCKPSEVKSKFRRLSVQNHPDKGGDPKIFNEIREAYEVLGDEDKKRYYLAGGMQLVKNVENSWKEVEGQKAQMESQLNQVPKNHPQYRMFEQQIKQQTKQFEPARIKPQIEEKMRNDELEVPVEISAEELYKGVEKYQYNFQRLVMCRGCKDTPDAPECSDCGRCPPEKIQVPKYANTPFGKQVVGMREKEQESRERCRKSPVKVTFNIPKGAKNGHHLKSVMHIGHTTPGKLPGKVNFVVSRGKEGDIYRIAEADLHTVLDISLEQALFGFEVTFSHLGGEKVTLSRSPISLQAEQVIKIKGKGLQEKGEKKRGDLYVRLRVQLPKVKKGEKSLTVSADKVKEHNKEAKLSMEDALRIEDAAAWRKWSGRAEGKTMKQWEKVDKGEEAGKSAGGKAEL
eukprot:TRINITY_DN4197_c0_g2_i1.p1 TRINITY_DN4197_c0_g2~~TRINITY_DN4197_c0_g2_i1.p1  ORF type:complete len:639 (-),score=151.57 TRINITY_DN4197_c0_g2_i1:266-2182(-)